VLRPRGEGTGANSVGDEQGTVNGVVNSASAMLTALNNNPQCDADQVCSDGRAKLQQLASSGYSQTAASAQSMVSTVQRVSSLMQSAGTSLRSAGISSPQGAQAKISQMQQGANALANGSAQLAQGVQVLVDQTKKMGGGLNRRPVCCCRSSTTPRRRRWRVCTFRRRS